jgi:RNA-binding protein YlmH
MTKDWHVHFHPDERLFVDRAWEWVERAGDRHEVRLTDFLDPRQQYILTTLVNRHPDAAVRFAGGYAEAERKRAIIAPDYRPLEAEDARICVLAVSSSDPRVKELDHGDYLGAILGLGIKREKVGDIQVLDDGCHCLLAEEIAPYAASQLTQVHRAAVSAKIIPLSDLIVRSAPLEEMRLTVASLRLDGIASDVFRLSRAKVQLPIRAGRCKVNWKAEEDPAALLKDGDVVSLQGFGRFKVMETEGMTKKGRMIVKIGKYV